ncbi:MAG: hypothetical protein WCY56_08535 [Aminobacteriaceae bacterium]
MKKTMDCYWYISESLRPWEAAVAGALARGLIKAGVKIHPFSGCGTESLAVPGLLSWRSLNAVERLITVAGKGKLWHLWGTPPKWWKLLRLRSRTIHTCFNRSLRWEGHPTVLSAVSYSSGESYIPPAFEMKMSWGAEEGKEPYDEGRPGLFLLAGKPDEGRLYAESAASLSSMLLDFDRAEDGVKLLSSGNCVLLLPGPTPSLSLLAAFAALMGVPTIAACSPSLDELLGKDGYVRLPSENQEDVREAFALVLGEGGRSASAFARRYVSDSFPPDKGAKKLKELYDALSGEEN